MVTHNNSFEIFEKVFEMGVSLPFSEIPIGGIFCATVSVKDRRRWVLNKYWKTGVAEWQDYHSPIICKKTGDDSLLELMTDFPVPEKNVPASNRGIEATILKFIR